MKTATIDDVLSWGPYSDYTKKIITKLFADRESLTAQDILKLNIPAKVRLWIVLREDMLDANILHEFACRCAEEALKLIDNPDPRSIAAIVAKRAWLRGEITDNELAYTADAAYAAADAADADAADAAWAAWAASASASADTAWAAAAAYAANDATRITVRNKQIEILKEILVRGECNA